MQNKQSLSSNKLILTSAISAGLALVAVLLTWSKLPEQVPLFYSKPWGQEQLAKPIFLFMPLSLALIFLILNITASKYLADKVFVRNVLIIGGAATAVLASITIVRIVFLIT